MRRDQESGKGEREIQSDTGETEAEKSREERDVCTHVSEEGGRGTETERYRQTEMGWGAGLVFMFEGGVCLCFWSCGVFLPVSSAGLFIISVPLCVAGGLCLSVRCVYVPLLSSAASCGDQVRFPARAV